MIVLYPKTLQMIKSWMLVLCVFSTYFAFSQNLEPLGTNINSEYNELHPLISPDGKTLYFLRVSHPANNFGVSKKRDDQGLTGSMDVWYSDLIDGSWTVARKMTNTINKDQYNDLFSITPDGNTALIRGVYNNGKRENEIGISVCKKKGVTWQQPNVLNIPKLSRTIKEDEGEHFTAFLSNSGKVLLLSFPVKKRSKNLDLYISILDKDGEWSDPEPLGDKINTNDSETCPFLASDGKTLYFATDRSGGQGGYDIWVSKRTGNSWYSWSKPVNLGPKINSKEDEMYYSIEATGQYAYLCSKKNSLGKNDIFRVNLQNLNKKKDDPVAAKLTSGDTTNLTNLSKETPTEIIPSSIVRVTGKVLDQSTNKAIEAKIIAEDLETGEELAVAISNSTTGEYAMNLPYGHRYAIRAESPDFLSVSKNMDLSQSGAYKEIKGEDLLIAPIEVGVAVQLNNIFFQFGKADLEEVSFLELDRIANKLNKSPSMVIEVQGHTDNVGSAEANLRLSQLRADAVRDYLISKKVSPLKVKSTGLGESQPIASNATSEGQAKNRRVEILVLKK
ncbi:MAG: OmpA family protein [Leadbetterella sp.]